MRKLILTLFAMAVSTLISAMPVLAGDSSTGSGMTRDECLIVAKNCADNVDTITQRIDRLNNEISKGTSVYTRDELGILNKKLEEANKVLEMLTVGS